MKNFASTLLLLITSTGYLAAAPGVNGTAAENPGETAAPSSPDGNISAMSAADAEAMAKEILPRIEEIRGLKFKRPVPVQVIDDAGARKHFVTRVEKFWPREQIRAEEIAFSHIGILPPGTDLLASLLDILEEQAGGYYDPDTDTFFVLGDMPRALAPLLMAHELTHALDDQHYDIDGLIEKVQGSSDGLNAVGAIIEGSGTLVMSVYLIKEQLAGRLAADALQALSDSEAGQAEKLKSAPALIQRSLLGPYILGQAFMLRGNLAGMMQGVKPEDLDRAFRDPPVSTEQVLHPEKYWDAGKGDAPRDITIPDMSGVLGKGWSLQADGMLGEMTLAILGGAKPLNIGDPAMASPTYWTNSVASGWDGDAWSLYRKGGRHVTVLSTVWDSEADAREFEESIAKKGLGLAVRRGDAVAYVGGDPGTKANALANATLRAAPATAAKVTAPSGTCPKPSSDKVCAMMYAPVRCGGCDYSNACVASAAGFKKSDCLPSESR